MAVGDKLVNTEHTKAMYQILDGKIGDLKSDVITISGVVDIPSDINDGYYRYENLKVTQTPSAGSGYKCNVVECQAGDVFRFTGRSYGAAARMYVFTDAEYNAISPIATKNTTMTEDSDPVVAPEDAVYLFINSYQSSVTVKKGIGIQEKIGNLNDDVNDLKSAADCLGKLDTRAITGWAFGGLNSGMNAVGNSDHNRIHVVLNSFPQIPSGHRIVAKIPNGFAWRVGVYTQKAYNPSPTIITGSGSPNYVAQDVVIPSEYAGCYLNFNVKKTDDSDFTQEEIDALTGFSIEVEGILGIVSDLNTTDKSTIVDAINEVNDQAETNAEANKKITKRNNLGFSNNAYYPYKYYPLTFGSKEIANIPLHQAYPARPVFTSGMAFDGERYLYISVRWDDNHPIAINKYDLVLDKYVASYNVDGIGHCQSMCYKDGELYVVSRIRGDTVLVSNGGTVDRITVLDADTLEAKRSFGMASIFDNAQFSPALGAIAWSNTFQCFIGITAAAGTTYPVRAVVLWDENGVKRYGDITAYDQICDGVTCDNSFIYAILSYKLAYITWDSLEVMLYNANKPLAEQETILETGLEAESVVCTSDGFYVNANLTNTDSTLESARKLFKVHPKTFQFIT